MIITATKIVDCIHVIVLYMPIFDDIYIYEQFLSVGQEMKLRD